MLRTRYLLSTMFGTLLLLVVAGPAHAGPAPLDHPYARAQLAAGIPR